MSSPVSQIKQIMTDNHYTLCVAESCTVGKLSAAFGETPGVSSFYKGAVIAYSNEIKISLLDVAKETLDKFGAVSEQVALQMAKGAQAKFKTTHAVAITGVAGPDGGTKEKPVGTVSFAYLGPDVEETCTTDFSGTRLQIQAQAVQEVIHTLLSELGVQTIG